MVVTEDIQHLIDGPWKSQTLERRANRLRADLEMFVEGKHLTVSMTPYEHKTAYMGLLDPPKGGFWDIRSRDPRPSLRVFGHFAYVDWFVALAWRPRFVRIDGRDPLGDRKDIEWEFAKLECEEVWGKLFPNSKPRTGGQISDFISERAVLG